MQLPEPLTVFYIAFTTRDILDIPAIDQVDFNARFFQNGVQYNPIYTRRFHGSRCNAHRLQITAKGIAICCEGGENPDFIFSFFYIKIFTVYIKNGWAG